MEVCRVILVRRISVCAIFSNRMREPGICNVQSWSFILRCAGVMEYLSGLKNYRGKCLTVLIFGRLLRSEIINSCVSQSLSSTQAIRGSTTIA